MYHFGAANQIPKQFFPFGGIIVSMIPNQPPSSRQYIRLENLSTQIFVMS